MFRFSAVFFVLCVLSGCAKDNEALHDDEDCGRYFCGCYEPYTKTVLVKLSDKDANPVRNASLYCLDTGERLGWTDSHGRLKLRVKGRISIPCGFFAECKTAYFETKDGGRERPFWFDRLVRGQQVDSVERNIEVIGDGS